MTGRWLVACGPDHGGRRQLEARLASSGLTNRFECRSFTLFADDRVAMLCDEAADVAVIGRLFARDGVKPLSALPEAAARAIAVDPGELGRRYWGRYLGLAGDARTGATRMVRDPSGGIAAYWTRWPSLWIATGDVRLLASLSPQGPVIDWDAVAARLLRPGHHGARTCIAAVEELLPGQMLVTNSPGAVETFWRPTDHVADRRLEPAGLAAIVDRTIGALAACHRHILATVSGGLDSSIIASSLARQGRAPTLLTIATADPRGDERRHAQMLADALGLPLRCDRYELADIDLERSSTAHLPWPGSRLFAQGYDRRRHDHARASGARAIFSGDGGDNVFGLTMSANPVVDRLRVEGVGPAMRTAEDVARLTGCSIPRVWRRALARLVRRRAELRPGNRTFLTDRAASMGATGPRHPWLDPGARLLPGKRAHIVALLRAQHYQQGYAPGEAEPVLPLLAQPIVEACLSIPSWRWTAGGENRAVARAAFAPYLPAAIVRRRTKGGPDSFCVQILERHRDTIRELLLGGALADHDLLDTAAIDRSLQSGDALRGDVHRILALVDAEAWVRGWSGGPDVRLA